MLRYILRAVIPAVLAILMAAPPSLAQSSPAGRRVVAKLFTDVLGPAAESTVRIRADGREVALGTIVDPNGYILTKGDELKGVLSVRLRDGSEYDAEYVGYHRETDLAMLRINAFDLPAASFADGKAAQVGNWVAAPGLDSEPVAAGVISAGVRKLYGAEALIEKLNKGFLGIMLDKPKDQDGVLVTSVEPGSAAARARMRVNDIIIRVEDRTVADPTDLKTALEDYKPGDNVVLTILRGENELELKVKLGSRSDIDRGEFQNKMGSTLSNRRTGFPAVIQHDMVLKPTDCGGPLVDLDGNILGINIARAGRVETWALPGDVIKPLIKPLKDGKFPPPTNKR
jgi:serine protease Do